MRGIRGEFPACLPQTVLQVQQREIHEQGVHYGIDIKYPEIQNGDRFNAAVRQAVDSLTESLKKEMSGVSAPDVPVQAT